MSIREFDLKLTTTNDDEVEEHVLASRHDQQDPLLDPPKSKTFKPQTRLSRLKSLIVTHKKKSIALFCLLGILIVASILGLLALLYYQVRNSIVYGFQVQTFTLCQSQNNFQVCLFLFPERKFFQRSFSLHFCLQFCFSFVIFFFLLSKNNFLLFNNLI